MLESANSEIESIAGHAPLDFLEEVAGFTSFRNEAVSDDPAELKARVQRLEAEISQFRAPTCSDPMKSPEPQLQRQDANVMGCFNNAD